MQPSNTELILIRVTGEDRPGLHLGIGLGLSFSYILFQTITSTFAINGNVPPVIAVWIPNILYAGIAFFLYQKAPK